MRMLVGFVFSTALFAGGGISLTVHSPESTLGKQTPGAAMLVAVDGCAAGANSKVEATAEGMVQGKRLSLPLQVVPTRREHVWAVKRAPALDQGQWVVVIRSMDFGTLVELGPNGQYRPHRTVRAAELSARLGEFFR